MNTVRIWFSKTGEASYISLLDLQRVMGRALKRSGLPVWYTLGFNPHIYMTFACPLPLGQESLVESVDVKTEQEAPDFEAWKAALAPVMPSGIKVQRVEAARMKAEQIGFARYAVTTDSPVAEAAAAAYNASAGAQVMKKSKRGLRPIELKEHIPAIELTRQGALWRFELLLPASETLNLNPSLLLHYLEEQYHLPTAGCNVLRTALYTKNMELFH